MNVESGCQDFTTLGCEVGVLQQAQQPLGDQ